MMRKLLDGYKVLDKTDVGRLRELRIMKWLSVQMVEGDCGFDC